ncbi:hypothetical protein [Pseudorhodoferax sp. Leaf267]|uniref:hypothetical protein n=1 Tax=Pseudorhodoferax sp. Leaf267 TaxID=1736316 RepID=UPI00190FEDCF|nr:hypothetical protein [Pseudorhodoferax sp. Leaf267]
MRASFLRVWGWPIALGLVSGTGLVSALLADGWYDWWSWLGLGLPVMVGAWFWWRPHKP